MVGLFVLALFFYNELKALLRVYFEVLYSKSCW